MRWAPTPASNGSRTINPIPPKDKQPMKSTNQILYSCPDAVVKVVRKKSGLRRYPPSDYACVLFVLNPKSGTRVRLLPGGAVEFMPSFDELRAVLTGIDPGLVAKLPDNFRNKPRARQLRYKRWNKARNRSKKDPS